MIIERIGKTNHAMGFNNLDSTLCGLTTTGDSCLKIPQSIRIKGKINCKKCIEIIFYCVNLNIKMIKKNK